MKDNTEGEKNKRHDGSPNTKQPVSGVIEIPDSASEEQFSPEPVATPLVIKTVRFEKSGSSREHYPTEPPLPQIAFVGKSNVGKSSLFNMVAHRKRLALVSNTPGRTRLVNFFVVNEEFRLVDLPGYGFAKASKNIKRSWDSMIGDYLSDTPDLRLVVALFDIRRDPSDDDIALINWLLHHGIHFIAVLTKSDKLTRSQLGQVVKQKTQWFGERGALAVLPFSALNRSGIEEILLFLGRTLKKRENPGESGSQAGT